MGKTREMDNGAIVFDLDDTLVHANKKGCTMVPRQTWHTLRWIKSEGLSIIVISYNPIAALVVATTGLGRYVDGVVSGIAPRNELFAKMLARYPGVEPTIYFDDRPDNIQEVSAAFPRVRCRQVQRYIQCSDLDIR